MTATAYKASGVRVSATCLSIDLSTCLNLLYAQEGVRSKDLSPEKKQALQEFYKQVKK